MASAQFGSVCDIAEYDSKVHTLALTADYQATEKLQLTAGITYNKAENSWEWEFFERDTSAFGGAAGAYDDYELNNQIDTYSDLSYTEIQYTLGGKYNFTDTFYTNLQGTYDVFESDEEYVYGDEDGEIMTGYIGFGWIF